MKVQTRWVLVDAVTNSFEGMTVNIRNSCGYHFGPLLRMWLSWKDMASSGQWFKYQPLQTTFNSGGVAEWLKRVPAKDVDIVRAGSNPATIVSFLFGRLYLYCLELPLE
jgi:hypothetical protein